MKVTVDTRVVEDKIEYVAENVTLDLPITIKDSIQREYDRLSTTDIESLQRNELIRQALKVIEDLGLTLTGTIS